MWHPVLPHPLRVEWGLRSLRVELEEVDQVKRLNKRMIKNMDLKKCKLQDLGLTTLETLKQKTALNPMVKIKKKFYRRVK